MKFYQKLGGWSRKVALHDGLKPCFPGEARNRIVAGDMQLQVSTTVASRGPLVCPFHSWISRRQNCQHLA